MQGRDKMINSFKFFHGFNEELNLQIETVQVAGAVRRLRATWEPTDFEEELTNMLSEQIAVEIDNEIINELTRRINSGESPSFEGEIQRLNHNAEYFNNWLNMGGGQRA